MDAFDVKNLESLPVMKRVRGDFLLSLYRNVLQLRAKKLLNVDLQNPAPTDKFSSYAFLGPGLLAPGFCSGQNEQLPLFPVYWRILNNPIPDVSVLDDPAAQCTFLVQAVILAAFGISVVSREEAGMETLRLLWERLFPWVLFLHEHFAALPLACRALTTEEEILSVFLSISLGALGNHSSHLLVPGMTKLLFRAWSLVLKSGCGSCNPPKIKALGGVMRAYSESEFTAAQLDEATHGLGSDAEGIAELISDALDRATRMMQHPRKRGPTIFDVPDLSEELLLFGATRTLIFSIRPLLPSLPSMLAQCINAKSVCKMMEGLADLGVKAPPGDIRRASIHDAASTLLVILSDLIVVNRRFLSSALKQGLLFSVAGLCQDPNPTSNAFAADAGCFVRQILRPCTFFSAQSPLFAAALALAEPLTTTAAFRENGFITKWDEFIHMFTVNRTVFESSPDPGLELAGCDNLDVRSLFQPHDPSDIMLKLTSS
uniref:Uncharacterized protein n=1 Tax=Mycena chlorophos TaxID=658473 RepID=A0ABQ0LP21_MYCCL|nr:predicted protein [Mycena chlorophos]